MWDIYLFKYKEIKDSKRSIFHSVEVMLIKSAKVTIPWVGVIIIFLKTFNHVK